MIISALEAYGSDFSDDARALKLAQALEALHERELEVDFSGCILDYPATSKVIDGALKGQNAIQPPRSLILTFNIAFQERMFIKWFFFGGQLLASDLYNEEVSVLREHITSALQTRNTSLVIRIRDSRTGQVTEPYVYG